MSHKQRPATFLFQGKLVALNGGRGLARAANTRSLVRNHPESACAKPPGMVAPRRATAAGKPPRTLASAALARARSVRGGVVPQISSVRPSCSRLPGGSLILTADVTQPLECTLGLLVHLMQLADGPGRWERFHVIDEHALHPCGNLSVPKKKIGAFKRIRA